MSRYCSNFGHLEVNKQDPWGHSRSLLDRLGYRTELNKPHFSWQSHRALHIPQNVYLTRHHGLCGVPVYRFRAGSDEPLGLVRNQALQHELARRRYCQNGQPEASDRHKYRALQLGTKDTALRGRLSIDTLLYSSELYMGGN